LREWTSRYRAMLVADRAFDLARHQYLAALYNCEAQEVVVNKASQRGVSEWLISYALHACDQRNATVFYLMPTDHDVSDFSTARINPAIEASPYLTSIVVDGGKGAGADRVTLKRIRNRYLYLRGALINTKGRSSKLKSVDADILVFDEYDEMPPRAVALARKRLDHSLLREVRLVSTPTYPEFGVHAAYLKSDQREWLLRCPRCNAWQELSLGSIVSEFDDLDRPVRWNAIDGEPCAICEKCGAALARGGSGEWVARFPDRPVAGFHITKLTDPTFSLRHMLTVLQTTNDEERREIYNQDLALPYTPKGSGVTEADLDDLCQDYALGPRAGETCFMGVDVGTALHVVIRASQANGIRPLRFAAAVDSFDEVQRLLRQYNVKRCVIDAMPETKLATATQAAAPEGVIWLAYYTEPGTSKALEAISVNAQQKHINLDRTRTLDTFFDDVFSGAALLPANARGIPDYYDHLTAQIRIIEPNRRGIMVARYIQKEGQADHFAHAENYCRAAQDMPAAPGRVDTQTSAPVVTSIDDLMKKARNRGAASQ
jgi:hypothetical protein